VLKDWYGLMEGFCEHDDEHSDSIKALNILIS
jgi:hypothetical protein